LEEIVAAPVKKTENTTGGIRCAEHATSSSRKSWHYFAKKWRSHGRHSSLADQSHGVFFRLVLKANSHKSIINVSEDKTVRACRTRGEKRNLYTILVEKPEGKRPQ
jgi:hypothetical protein